MRIVRHLLTWWGKFRFMFQFLGFYLSVIALILNGVTAYNTTLRDWAMVYFGFDLTLLEFGLGVVGLMLLGMVIEKVATVPYLIGQGNREAYKHDNPMRRDLEDIKKEQAEAKKRQDEQNSILQEHSQALDRIAALLEKQGEAGKKS